MSSVRFDRRKVIILGFMCALFFYEVSYRWSKSVDLANTEASRQQCINQLKVAEVHNQKLEAKYNSLEKDYRTVEKSRNEEKEKCSAEISKVNSQLDMLRTSSYKEIKICQEKALELKEGNDKLVKLFDKEKVRYEDELSNMRSEMTRLSNSEQSWKTQLSSLNAQLQIAQDRIISLQKEMTEMKLGQTPALNNTILAPQVPHQKQTVKKPVLQKPGEKPDLPKPNENEVLAKPQIVQQKGPKSEGLDTPVDNKDGQSEIMEGKADSYKEMALKLSNALAEAPIPPPINNEAVIDSPGDKMEKYLNEGRPDGDQLKKLIPNVKPEENVKNDIELPKAKEQRRKKSEKEDADFENLNDDDNLDQYEEGAVDNRADQDKGFEREGHIEEPQNDLGINNEPNEVEKGERVMLLPK